MHVLGEVWAPSGAPLVLVAEDGRKLTRTVHTYGVVEDDGAGQTNLGHVDPVLRADGTVDPDTILFAGRKFRAAPA